jgi:hypothetical protein
MMSSEQIQTQELLWVLSAAATELPAAALRDVRSNVRGVNGILPHKSPESVIEAALNRHTPLHALAGRFSYTQHPDAACMAFTLAAAAVEPAHSAARVFLADVAEWLIIPPAIYRQLARHGLNDTTSEAA